MKKTQITVGELRNLLKEYPDYARVYVGSPALSEQKGEKEVTFKPEKLTEVFPMNNAANTVYLTSCPLQKHEAKRRTIAIENW